MLHFVTVHVICMLTHGLAAGEGGQLMMVKLVVNVCCVLCSLVGAPVITVPPQSLAVENGSNTEFTCTATGLGNLRFTWTTPVGTLPSSVESNDTAALTTTSILSLTSVDTSYSGDYICTVRNERESDTAQATLSVIG